MNQPSKQVVKSKEPRVSLVDTFAKQMGVDASKVMGILRNTCFKVKRGDPPATDEEVASLMIVARQYNLNPFLREIYAFRGQNGAIVPLVGYDGWIRIVEAQPSYEGHSIIYGTDDTTGPDGKDLGFFCECTMYRSDRKHPIVRRMYHNENVRNTDPWKNSPTRMLLIRAYVQTARAAFGLGGIYDEDEGEVVAMGPGVDYLPNVGKVPESTAKAQTPTGRAREQAEDAELPADEGQLEQVRERLGVTGVPDSLVLARFQIGSFEELRSHQIPEVLKFIADNAP